MGLQEQDLECLYCTNGLLKHECCSYSRKGLLNVKMLDSASFGCRLICHTLMGKLLPWERERVRLSCCFMARQVVICGGRVAVRLGATGQHSRGTRVFSPSVTCICVDIVGDKVEQLFTSNVCRKCPFLPSSPSLHFFSHFSWHLWERMQTDDGNHSPLTLS